MTSENISSVVVRMIMKLVLLLIQQKIENNDFTVVLKMIVTFFKNFVLHTLL